MSEEEAGRAARAARRTFLMIITRNGSLMPSVLFASAGHVMYVVLTLVPITSSTLD